MPRSCWSSGCTARLHCRRALPGAWWVLPGWMETKTKKRKETKLSCFRDIVRRRYEEISTGERVSSWTRSGCAHPTPWLGSSRSGQLHKSCEPIIILIITLRHPHTHSKVHNWGNPPPSPPPPSLFEQRFLCDFSLKFAKLSLQTREGEPPLRLPTLRTICFYRGAEVTVPYSQRQFILILQLPTIFWHHWKAWGLGN